MNNTSWVEGIGCFVNLETATSMSLIESPDTDSWSLKITMIGQLEETLFEGSRQECRSMAIWILNKSNKYIVPL